MMKITNNPKLIIMNRDINTQDPREEWKGAKASVRKFRGTAKTFVVLKGKICKTTKSIRE